MGQILSQPVTEKYTEKGEDKHLYFGVSSMQGWRVSMEDSHAAVLNVEPESSSNKTVAYFGVYDGHGGDRTAQFAGQRTHGLVTQTPGFAKRDYGQALIDGFLATDAQIIVESNDDGLDASGCAATAVILVPHETVICGNAGDSRTVLGTYGTAKSLSFDHKPDNEGERSRICAGGGFVDMGRVNGNLALSRALGDLNFKKNTHLSPEQQIVTAYPDIIEHPLDDDRDEFLVLACDGIWDCMTSQEVVEFVRRGIADKLPLEDICELLMEECLAPESDISGVGCDNMTVCVVALFHRGQTKEQWYDMIAQRVAEGRGPVAARSTEQIREQLQSQRSQQSSAHGDHDDATPPEGAVDEVEPSQLMLQQIFGGGDALGRLDPETTSSLLSRIGIRFSMHQGNEDDDEDQSDDAEPHDGNEHSIEEVEDDIPDAEERERATPEVGEADQSDPPVRTEEGS